MRIGQLGLLLALGSASFSGANAADVLSDREMDAITAGARTGAEIGVTSTIPYAEASAGASGLGSTPGRFAGAQVSFPPDPAPGFFQLAWAGFPTAEVNGNGGELGVEAGAEDSAGNSATGSLNGSYTTVDGDFFSLSFGQFEGLSETTGDGVNDFTAAGTAEGDFTQVGGDVTPSENGQISATTYAIAFDLPPALVGLLN